MPESAEIQDAGGGAAGATPLPDLIFSQTDGGREIVARMVDFMYGRVEGARAADQLSAAKELMDRAWGKPPAAASPSAPNAEDAESGRTEYAADKLREMIAAALAADAERSET